MMDASVVVRNEDEGRAYLESSRALEEINKLIDNCDSRWVKWGKTSFTRLTTLF